MRLTDAYEKIYSKANRSFEELFTQSQLEGIIKNKGKSGQILELAIGLQNTSSTLDFEDGELKTNKVDVSCKPLETMFITQISQNIDDILDGQDFYESKLYKKINNLLYVPICKDGSPEEWFIHTPIHVDLNSDVYKHILKKLESDYYSISNKLNKHINSGDGLIHTSNGEYIQIRSKDSKPYHPIHSNKYDKYISNKNHAFYFKKEFMKEVQNIGYSK